MKAHFGLPSVVGDLNEGKPPISVKFEIPYFTTSGIQVILKGSVADPDLALNFPSSGSRQKFRIRIQPIGNNQVY